MECKETLQRTRERGKIRKEPLIMEKLGKNDTCNSKSKSCETKSKQKR